MWMIGEGEKKRMGGRYVSFQLVQIDTTGCRASNYIDCMRTECGLHFLHVFKVKATHETRQ